MEFCKKCKLLMYPQGDQFVCLKCGAEADRNGNHIIVEKQQEKEIQVLEKRIDILPKTQAECLKCGNNEAFYILRQTRASDEPTTMILTCTKCNNKWRQY